MTPRAQIPNYEVTTQSHHFDFYHGNLKYPTVRYFAPLLQGSGFRSMADCNQAGTHPQEEPFRMEPYVLPATASIYHHPEVDRAYGLYRKYTRVLSTIIIYLPQDGYTLARPPIRSNIQVGSLEVGSFHTAPIRAPISPLDLMGVVWEAYGRLPTYKLPSCNGL